MCGSFWSTVQVGLCTSHQARQVRLFSLQNSQKNLLIIFVAFFLQTSFRKNSTLLWAGHDECPAALALTEHRFWWHRARVHTQSIANKKKTKTHNWTTKHNSNFLLDERGVLKPYGFGLSRTFESVNTLPRTCGRGYPMYMALNHSGRKEFIVLQVTCGVWVAFLMKWSLDHLLFIAQSFQVQQFNQNRQGLLIFSVELSWPLSLSLNRILFSWSWTKKHHDLLVVVQDYKR